MLADVGLDTRTLRHDTESFSTTLSEELGTTVRLTTLSCTASASRCSGDSFSVLCREIADDVKAKLHELGLERYKLCVQVVVGEQKGAGVRMGCRCFWDPKTDGYAEQMYQNESLYAVAFVAGIYLY